ncbi:MAG TPA: ribose 5-phosphate isomerase B [Spirochaetales bacterium]|nr:ribose 5-phosphate isomerase B [Spirochaetales bacterium]
MRIVIANDHGAVALKHELVDFLRSAGHEVANLGVDTEDRVDYPDKAREACLEFLKGGYDFGIVLCGTGIGISIAANKIDGIRCALVHDAFTARLAREHNDANFLALGGRVTYAEKPADILAAFMAARYEGGRHADRLVKIAKLEMTSGS